MSINASGVARIRHADTGEVYTIEADELDWDTVAADERQMGTEVAHAATIDHPELGQLTWTLWEYPLGMENDREVDIGPHQMLETFRLSLGDDGAGADRQARVDRMVEWFLENYEDPAQRTPYESAEGGYIWIWGGPYDALEQIGDHFPHEDQDLIEAAVSEVERDGIVDWAPVPSPDDYDDGDRDEPEEEGELVPNDVDLPDGGLAESSELSDILESIRLEDGPVFGRDDQDRIELLSWTGPPPTDPHLIQVLREHTADLLAQLDGTNAHQDLLASVRRYADALGRTPASIPQLYAEGVHLENTSARTEIAILADDLPPLPGSSAAALDSVKELHGTMIMLSPAGAARVEASARYRRDAENQEDLTRSADQLAKAVYGAPELFGPLARELAVQIAASAGQGPHPERSNQTAVGVLKGILISAVTFAGLNVLETIVGGGLAATPAGVAMQEGVTTLATAAGSFLLNNVEALRTFAAAAGPDLVWLKQLSDWILHQRHMRKST